MRRNCLLKHVIVRNIKERIKIMGRRGRRHNQLVDGLKERGGSEKLKEEALDRNLRRIRFGTCYGHVLWLRNE